MHTFRSKSGRLITMRPPQPGDEAVLYRFATEIGQEDTYILINPLEPVTWEEEVAYLKDVLRRIQVGWQVHYLAFSEETLIGSCQVSLQGRRKKHVGSFGISLLKNYRSDGIGRAMADYLLAEAKAQLGIQIITLEHFGENQIAHHLYEQLGFKEYGRLPQGLSYKQRYDEAVLMYKVME